MVVIILNGIWYAGIRVVMGIIQANKILSNSFHYSLFTHFTFFTVRHREEGLPGLVRHAERRVITLLGFYHVYHVYHAVYHIS
jgi:hypothetical protein